MDIFGIGALEILFILIIALLVMGPEDLEKTGRAIGKFMRRIVTSDNWRIFQETSKDIRNLPTRLIREAGLEDMQEDLKSIGKTDLDLTKGISNEIRDLKDDINSWVTPQPPLKKSSESTEPKPEQEDPELADRENQNGDEI